MKSNPEIVSAMQEALRTFVIGEIMALIPVLGIIATGIDIEVGGFNIRWLLAASLMAHSTITNVQTAIGRGIEKYLYKTSGENPLSFKSLE